jgi:hypothetical protein
MNFSEETQSNYEFTNEQNAQISRLARMMLIVAVLFFVSGGLTILSALSSLSITGFVQGAALLVIGYSLYTASNSFKKIVETTGSDIANLMKAIDQLYTACSMQLYSIAAVIVIAVLVTLLG